MIRDARSRRFATGSRTSLRKGAKPSAKPQPWLLAEVMMRGPQGFNPGRRLAMRPASAGDGIR